MPGAPGMDSVDKWLAESHHLQTQGREAEDPVCGLRANAALSEDPSLGSTLSGSQQPGT